MLAGGVIVVASYFYFGLEFLSRTWLNLDVVGAVSLIVVGAFGICFANHGQ